MKSCCDCWVYTPAILARPDRTMSHSTAHSTQSHILVIALISLYWVQHKEYFWWKVFTLKGCIWSTHTVLSTANLGWIELLPITPVLLLSFVFYNHLSLNWLFKPLQQHFFHYTHCTHVHENAVDRTCPLVGVLLCELFFQLELSCTQWVEECWK